MVSWLGYAPAEESTRRRVRERRRRRNADSGQIWARRRRWSDPNTAAATPGDSAAVEIDEADRADLVGYLAAQGSRSGVALPGHDTGTAPEKKTGDDSASRTDGEAASIRWSGRRRSVAGHEVKNSWRATRSGCGSTTRNSPVEGCRPR